ncbi:putative MFS-type transporter YhjX [subsurface metagenome]
MSFASLVMFYASFLLIGLGASLGVFMIPTTAVVRWFRRNLGKANGALALGFNIGGLLVPIVAKIIDTYGWQNSLIIFGIVWCVISIPLSFVFRSRPEDYGMLPNGKPQEDLEHSSDPKAHDFSLSVKEALRTPAFWLLSTAFMLHRAGIMAVLTHVMPYLTSSGIGRATASMIVMFISIAALVARLPYGWLADIFNKKYVAFSSIFLTSVGLLLFSFINAHSLWLIIPFVLIYGIGYAGGAPLRPPIIREYFGTKNFGTIWGLSGIFSTVAMMVTPLAAGWVYDMRGVYDPIWLVLSGTCMAGAILILAMPSAPRPRGNLLTT